MEIKVFSQDLEQDLEKEIFDEIERVEKRARARLLEESHVRLILNAVRETPHGSAYADGGHVANRYRYSAETSYFEIFWVTRHGKKYVKYSVWRDWAKHVRYGAWPTYEIDYDERKAFENVFSDQVKRVRKYLLKRALRSVGITVPPEEVISGPERFRLIEKDPAGIYLFAERREYILVTSLGVFRKGVDKNKHVPKRIEDALRDLGMNRESILDEREFARSLAQLPQFGRGFIVDDRDDVFDGAHESLVRAIEERLYGVGVQLDRDGFLNIFAWYTRRDVKKVFRGKSFFVRIIPTPATPPFAVLDDRGAAWELAFPERARKCQQLLNRRKLRAIGIPFEKIPEGDLEIQRIWPELRMALVKDTLEARFLLTPLGARELPYKSFKSAREAFLEAYGFPLPPKRRLRWEEIEALIAFHSF